MSKGTNWTLEQANKNNLVLVGDKLVKADKLVGSDISKLEPVYFGEPKNNPDGTSLLDRCIGNEQKPNAKIKNATKSVNDDGVKFDSKLERYFYDLLKGAGIDFEFQKKYILQEKFKYGTETVRQITLTIDMWIESKNMIIDTKGLSTQQSVIKYKILKRKLFEAKEAGLSFELPTIEVPQNKKECDLLLNRILYDK